MFKVEQLLPSTTGEHQLANWLQTELTWLAHYHSRSSFLIFCPSTLSLPPQEFLFEIRMAVFHHSDPCLCWIINITILFHFSHMTLDLLINQVLEKDAACFLQCETRSIEAGAAKTWGGWIPTSNCWQHRTPQSKHWITEAEQWSRGPTWMTLTQLNLLSVWSNFHKYWAKGIVGKYMPHISQIPSSSTECPPTATEALVWA